MSKNYETWHKIKYVLFAFIPWLMFKALAMVVSSIASVIVSTKYIQSGGSVEEAQNYIVEYFQGDAAMIITVAVQLIAMFFGLLILFKGLKRNDFGSPFKAFPRLALPGTVVLMVGSCFLTLLAMSLYAIFAPGLLASYNELITASGLTGFTALSIIATLIIAPVNEEILFRGVSFGFLKKAGLKFWLINIIQAFLFGVTHMNIINGITGGVEYLNIVQGTYAFVLGLFLGYLRERTGKLWAPILGHIVFNFVGTFVTSWLATLGESVSGTIMIAGGIVLTILGFFLIEFKRGKITNE